MKPDWDKLASAFNYKTNGHVADVDCTSDDAKALCETYGVQGYPTLKYFKKGGDEKGDSYEGGREYADLKKFMKKNSKQPCDVSSLENCDKKDKKYIEAIKSLDAAAMQEAYDNMTTALAEKKDKKAEEEALFEKQKDEAMATQARMEEAKKAADKLEGKYGYKISILAAKIKAAEGKKDEM